MKRSILILAGILTCVSSAFAAPRDELSDAESYAADIQHAEEFLGLTYTGTSPSNDGKQTRWIFKGVHYHGYPIVVDIAVEASDEEMAAAATAAVSEAEAIWEWTQTK